MMYSLTSNKENHNCIQHQNIIDNSTVERRCLACISLACSLIPSACEFMCWGCCHCQVASVVPDSVQPHRRQPTRLLCPWDSPGKNTGVGCHFLLQVSLYIACSICKQRMLLPSSHHIAASQRVIPEGDSRLRRQRGLPSAKPSQHSPQPHIHPRPWCTLRKLRMPYLGGPSCCTR